ncbi:MAG: bifunctional acetate--CoA ligase family protein/GNAT family N-acetyltransferase [Rhodospirillales bacterium]
MSTRNLDKMFYPRSVAVVGASNRDGMAGHIVMHNLLHGGFEGPIMPVSAEDRAISGVLAYPRVEALPETPDLAVVCASSKLDSTVRALAERGTRAAILLSDGIGDAQARHRMLSEAEQVGLRLLGPGCLGLMVPGIGLNASVAPVAALPGGVAFVSQSLTVCAAVLDWAREHDIGFSHFISLGDTLDIHLADIIDYLGSDAMTRAILVYIEGIRHGRPFMSAGRGASRNKPVLVIKSGRTAEGRAALGVAEAASRDDVYDAAIRRAGMLRVQGFSELFAAVETLGRSRPLRGDRLAIISNGVGIAVMAVDNLILSGGRLAQLSEATLAAIAPHVSSEGPAANPIHLPEGASATTYAAVTKAVFADRNVDAILVMHAPTTAASSAKIADAVIIATKEARGTLLASFMGGSSANDARHRFSVAGIPTFDTVNQAVTAFMHMVRYRRSQDILMQTPPSKPAEFNIAPEDVRAKVGDMLRRGQSIVTGREAISLLAGFGIRTMETATARSPDEAVAVAERLGFPVSLKLVSRDGGSPAAMADTVSLLESREAVKSAAQRLLSASPQRGQRSAGDSFIVERAIRRPDIRELRISVADDPVFGPVIVFGHGGPASDVIADRAVALPPLNMSLALEVIQRTRVCRLLQRYGDVPAADISAVCLALVQVSQMIIDVPEIAAVEINPLLVDDRGAYVADAQLLIAPATEVSERRLAIRPYPKELEEEFISNSGRKFLLRPIRPEDEPAHHDFVGKCTPEDMRLRFFHLVRALPHAEMARLTQIDYDREMAFIATGIADNGQIETLGVVRTVADLNNDKAEYAILVRSDMKGQGLGRKLMKKIVDYCRSRGTRRIVGLVLRDNVPMLDLIQRLGFTARKVPDDDLMEVELELQSPETTPEPPQTVA